MAAKWSLTGALRGMLQRETITEETWDDLEAALITADFGPGITEQLVEALRSDVERLAVDDPADLRRMLRERLEERFAEYDPTLSLKERPAVILVVGVNGVGKTTTIGKLCLLYTSDAADE